VNRLRQEKIPPVIQAMYDLLLWLMERVEKFPRSSRFVLGDRIEESGLLILRLLIKANFVRERKEILQEANLELDQLRYLVRISLDRRFITPKQYAFASEKMTEVGRQIGGWAKAGG
jgi:hypothetical protein